MWYIGPEVVDWGSISPDLDQFKGAQYGFVMRLKACCKEENLCCLEAKDLVSRHRNTAGRSLCSAQQYCKSGVALSPLQYPFYSFEYSQGRVSCSTTTNALVEVAARLDSAKCDDLQYRVH